MGRRFACFLLSLSFFGQLAVASEVTFSRENHLGFRAVDIISIEKNEVVFDGKKLNSKMPAKVIQALQEIEKGPAQNKGFLTCTAGRFQFSRSQGGKSTRFSGCTEGVAYAAYWSHLETVRQFAQDGQ